MSEDIGNRARFFLSANHVLSDREPSISLNVEPLDTIICCRAGYGLRHDPPSQFMIARLKSTFASIYDRAQNAATKRLFDLKAHGKLTVVMPYLGQDDSRLKFQPRDIVTREGAYAYPTDFSAMSTDWIDRLSRRGEQLTVALVNEHESKSMRRIFRLKRPPRWGLACRLGWSCGAWNVRSCVDQLNSPQSGHWKPISQSLVNRTFMT